VTADSLTGDKAKSITLPAKPEKTAPTPSPAPTKKG